MLIKNKEEKPKKIGFNYLVAETFYVCDGKKECQNSPSCGVYCKYTKDRNHWLKGTIPKISIAAPMS